MVRVPETVLAAVRELASSLGETPIDVRLFGSYARADADEDSDVDVLVVLEHVDWATRGRVIDRAADIGLEHDLLLSPLVVDRATWELWRRQERLLAREIERDGIRP
jgi:predicted nucleotidyltransferase